jgi:hypothetical protein
MPTKATHVYQFKITLKEISPLIWRRIQVPDTYTFWDLHVAIQDAMGWLDYHLHQFTLFNPKTGERDCIGIPDDDEWDPDITTLAGWKIPMVSYFSLQNKEAEYEYDFGDSWRHKIILESINPLLPQQIYPVCLAGERACPPEDCGGVWGYDNLLKILKNSKHEEYIDTKMWVGKEFESEEFNPAEVRFDDPQERWKVAFLDEVSF